VAILTLSGLGFAAGGQSILSGIDLALAEGEFVALLGPSGCGKSTLLRLIAGFERPAAGAIALEGRPVSGPGLHVAPEERGVGMVFQSYALWPHLDVAGNVGYGLRVRGLPPEARAAQVAEALATVGLSGFERRRVQSLSGGQRQRVALARCLALRPRLMLLDEPLANLDAHLREAMVEEFRHLHRATGATILYVTHDQAEAMALADRVAVMARGAVLQLGSPAQVWREPASAEVARFLGRGEVVAAELLDPGPPARLRLFGQETHLRAPAGLRAGPVEVCLRPEGLALAPGGLPVRVLGERASGARRVVTVAPEVAPDCRLRLELDHDQRPEAGFGLVIRDGWVIGGPAARVRDTGI
jgi:iron(III) transport system ATP-binding protein